MITHSIYFLEEIRNKKKNSSGYSFCLEICAACLLRLPEATTGTVSDKTQLLGIFFFFYLKSIYIFLQVNKCCGYSLKVTCSCSISSGSLPGIIYMHIFTYNVPIYSQPSLYKTRYNDKIRYNDNLNVTKYLLKRWLSIRNYAKIVHNIFKQHMFWIFVRISLERQF